MKFKVTVADMLANVGGTFGLFLGLSFLSVFEILVQIFNFVQNKLQGQIVNNFFGHYKCHC